MHVSLSLILLIIAIIIFVLVGLGVALGSAGGLQLLAIGLAFFAAAHLPV
jgi:hypothetical protein